MLLFFETESVSQLCLDKQVNNQCICDQQTESENGKMKNSVISFANCARINLQNFPSEEQLQRDLVYLDISHNEIKKLDKTQFSLNNVLQTLILSYNLINTIEDTFFDNFKRLNKLDLSHNKIVAVSKTTFKNLNHLEHLDLSFNNIPSLPNSIFLPLKNLDFLSLSYNNQSLGKYLIKEPHTLSNILGINPQITSLEFNNLGLDALSSIFFENYTSVKHLSLADNPLDNVPTVPYSVEYLDLSGTEITTLQAKYLNYHSLKTLKLNRLDKLENIHKYAFYNLPNLIELSITECTNLQYFNELTFGLLSPKSVLPLKKLNLARNALTTLNYTYKYLLKNLEFVDLSDNAWICDCNLLWFQEFEQFFARNIK